MKKILLMATLFASWAGYAQNNLVVFSENGEKFFLLVNGIKQNITPETNVKVTDLIHPQYKVKVMFEEKAKGVIDQTVYMMDGGEPVKNHEFVYNVKMTKKGEYKIRPMSMVAISESKADPSQTVVHYSTSEPTTNTSGNTNVNVDGTSNVSTNVSTNVHVTETSSQTQVSNGAGNGANVGVNINGMGVNISINDNMGGMNQNSSTTVTSQTITSSSSMSVTHGSHKRGFRFANPYSGSVSSGGTLHLVVLNHLNSFRIQEC
jgi:hypothetical protein